jgi:GTP-binding protein
MVIHSAEFIASFPNVQSCPKDGLPEFAFIGRSNVGKSSLLNLLTGRKSLAKVSSTPGKTQLLNYFLINKKWYLVDLPGYGYARLSKEKIKGLANMVNGYFSQRKSLTCAFVLIDANLPPTKIDLTFIEELGSQKVPLALIFTKADKSGKMTVEKNIAAMMEALSATWPVLPSHIVTSSEKRLGRDEVMAAIETLI